MALAIPGYTSVVHLTEDTDEGGSTARDFMSLVYSGCQAQLDVELTLSNDVQSLPIAASPANSDNPQLVGWFNFKETTPNPARRTAHSSWPSPPTERNTDPRGPRLSRDDQQSAEGHSASSQHCARF